MFCWNGLRVTPVEIKTQLAADPRPISELLPFKMKIK